MIDIILGSKTDLPVWEKALILLEEFGVKYKLSICSAHRSPDYLETLLVDNSETDLYIASGGMSFHLAGVIASKTIKPIICVPLEGKIFGGMDALMSSIQMPKGVPVGVMTVGSHGTINGVLYAVQILAMQYDGLAHQLRIYKNQQELDIIGINETLEIVGKKD